MRILLVTGFFLICSFLTWSQSERYYPVQVIDGDTAIVVSIEEAVIETEAKRSAREQRKYSRLKRKVQKVYPYAKAAGDLMKELDQEIRHIHSEKERKRFLKAAEKELKSQFEGELKALTMSEGIILIKLIDRETGDCSYELIQELKGNFSAFMWQSVARLFGQNLKSEYEPHGADRRIEYIVKAIERGEIKVAHKEI
ncbi:MAG: DUF4294 domain-containing protein, partial [Flavobacteriales bacterium]|nr:DUF4294 domain-containing protein [Flavobacteriales bacterium]